MKNALPPACRLAAVSLLALTALSVNAAVVFQADFSGSGGGTGGAADIVALGGTGVISNTNSSLSNVTASVDSTVPLVAGGGSYLRLNDQGVQSSARAAGVTVTPASAASSFDSWYANTSGTTGFDTLNGGFDFLFRTTSSADLDKDTLRFFDVGVTGVPYRLALSSTLGDKLSLALNQNGTNIARATSAVVNLSANTTYRIAGTLSTSAGGLVTVNLYLAAGDTVIDTTSTTHRIATSTSSVVLDAGNSISSSFGTAGGFTLGMTSNIDADTKTLDLDSFRIYNAVPATFDGISSIPEPGSFALVLGGLVGLGVCLRRRR